VPAFPAFPDDGEATAVALQVSRGVPGAENALAALFRESVFAFLRSRVHRGEEAWELTDDVLMAALLSLRRGLVRDHCRIGAFIHGIAVHVAASHSRRRGRQPPLQAIHAELPDWPGLERTEDDQRRMDVHRALQMLGEVDRSICTLLLDEGLSEAEVADRLGIKAAAVRQRKSRAIRRLQRLL
jgi:RNA polymerase sigma factor (sigma-70 family)